MTERAATDEKTHIRWMIRADLPEVFAIERFSFEHPWTADDFMRCLRKRYCIGFVAEWLIPRRVVGYMIYELNKRNLFLLNLAVDPSARGCGVGRAMVDKLLSKLSPSKRTELRVAVSEENLNAQLFFRACGFRCVGVCREFWEGYDDDAFLFKLRPFGDKP